MNALMPIEIRQAVTEDLPFLADLWLQGWRDGHASILPAELTALRTLESFAERLEQALPLLRVAGPVGDPSAFHLIKGEELNQFYVHTRARGTGMASVLLADAEMRFRETGVARPWLACAIGNLRAARFYEKSRWNRTGVENIPTETSLGPFPLEVWRYEKHLGETFSL